MDFVGVEAAETEGEKEALERGVAMGGTDDMSAKNPVIPNKVFYLFLATGCTRPPRRGRSRQIEMNDGASASMGAASFWRGLRAGG